MGVVGAVIAVVLVVSLLAIVGYAVAAAVIVVHARRATRVQRAVDRELDDFLDQVLAGR